MTAVLEVGSDCCQWRWTIWFVVEKWIDSSHGSPPFARALERRNTPAGCVGREIDSSTRRKFAAFIYRYAALEEHSEDTWRALRDAAGDTVSELPDIDQRIALARRADLTREQRNNYGPTTLEGGKEERDWNGVFAGTDILTPEGISQAYQRSRLFEPPHDYERFFREAIARVGVGAEADFINAIVQVSEFDLFTVRTILSLVPTAWKDRVSVKPAFARAILYIARRHCLEVSRGETTRTRLPFDLACELSGLSEEQISEAVSRGVSETAGLLETGRLFTLVGLLMTKVSPAEGASWSRLWLAPPRAASRTVRWRR